jgi:hypothetical protein|tara:strand:+ start:1012 stop:2562 length:1551 start_codon:yes stop_codon:yes gene_type:complete
MMTLTQRLQQFQIGAANNIDVAPQPIVSFPGWAPDRAPLGSTGSINAINVIPTTDGFRPLPDLKTQASALSARCQGAVAVQATGGEVYTYAADASKLYRIDVSESLTEVTGDYEQAASDAQIEYAHFGNTILATHIATPLQGATIGSGNFSDHITSSDKPQARHIAVIRDQVVLGDTTDETDGAQPSRVWWSGLNDSNDFTPAASTLCDFQNVAGGEAGKVMRIVGGAEYGLIFLEHQIVRMSFVGAPLAYQLDTINRRHGTPISGSVIGHGRLVFYVSEEGFYFTDGTTSTPIGHGMVDRFFWNNFDLSNQGRMFSAIDPVNKTVCWSHPGEGTSTAGEPNRIWFYNWAENKWSEGEVTTQLVFTGIDAGLTLAELDTISSELSGLPFPLGSRAYQGGDKVLAAFNGSNVYCTFEGANLAATLDTGEFQPFRGQRSEITGVRPYIDGGTITAAVASRIRVQDSASFGSAASLNASGLCTLLSEGRHHRVRCSVAAGGTWEHAQGVEVTAVGTGVT